jgi:hypothetical protein
MPQMKTPAHNLQKKRVIAALLVWLPWAGAAADPAVLPDPTRPPAGFVDELPKTGAGAGDAAGAAPGRPAVPADEAANPGLQSVLIPRQGRPVAIIGGQYVPLGERYGDWELIAVAESEVVLARGKQRKVMKLTPRAEKKLARATAAGNNKAIARPARPVGASGTPPSRKESETGR